MDKLIQWALNQLLRRGMNMAVQKGADLALGAQKPAAEMTPEERRQAKAGKRAARSARQAMRMGRKLW